MLPLVFALAVLDTTPAWQQGVRYEIHATLDESTSVLSGTARITYVNHSPDTLRDFYVHQYLNAFRPGSRWAAYDSAAGVERYQHMRDPDYAFERIRRAVVMGDTLRPDYPGSPDSTIAHWTLPRALAPGDSFVADIDWQARLSTLPRRQGRRGRRYDFAEWYPKVVVYDRYGWEAHPVYPAGEFYGEFATFDVTLDLPADEVIGATGVPVCGDPGWEQARANPDIVVDYQRDWYPGAPHDCPAARPGRKTVRFYAEHVHHFAFSLNPDYVYEQGRYGPVVIHVLYLPTDRATWGGTAVRNSEIALAWLDSLYGPYQWPQFTNVHRIEGGGTEFPMMIMDGGASIGLIVHETGHQYTMGQLANNEWREGFLDEGFTSFQSGWFFERHGGERALYYLDPEFVALDLDRWSEPVSLVSEDYRDFTTYNLMIYSKAQLFYEELRYVVGDSTMRAILRTYFERDKLRHVDEDDFRRVCEEVSHRDLKWLFGEWLHGTPLFDYRLDRVRRTRLADGRWRTTVTIRRLADGMMPVEIGDRDTIYARADGLRERETVSFVSARKPGRLMLDPRLLTHDWNYLNNAEPRAFLGRTEPPDVRLDDVIHDRARRDRVALGLVPVVWSNDAGGVTVGARARWNYMGEFDRGTLIATSATAAGAEGRLGLYFRLVNPVGAVAPRVESTVAAWSVEGRTGALLHVDRDLRRHLDQPSSPHAGVDVLWMATSNLSYLDRRLWDDAGTVEVGPWFETARRSGGTLWRADATARGGLVYRAPGTPVTSGSRYDVSGYGRFTAAASVRTPFVLGTDIGFRAFGGAYVSNAAPAKQRRIYIAGADPYQTFVDPLVRSRGALFERPGFYYQSPGDANLRGFSPAAAGRWALSLDGELTRNLWSARHGFVRRLALEGFTDGGIVDTAAVPNAKSGHAWVALYDGGVGVLSEHALGDLAWTFRFELPLVVSRPGRAQDVRPGKGRLALRWQVSLAPSF